jgi:Uma2 family endonuclease
MVALQNQPPNERFEYPGPITYADWLELPEDHRRLELWNGELVESTTQEEIHQDIESTLGYALMTVVRTISGAKLFYEYGVKLSGNIIVEPDILVFTGKAGGKRTRRAIEGPPDLVVEIVSPTSRKRDFVQKTASYADAGVPEYWIVDPDRRALVVSILKDGAYERTIVYGGEVPCQALGGAMIDISFLATIGADLAEESEAPGDQE